MRLSIGSLPSIIWTRTRFSSIWFRHLDRCLCRSSPPALASRTWRPVDVVDLGFGVLTVPAGEARHLLGDLLSRDDHAEFVAYLSEDPDIATT